MSHTDEDYIRCNPFEGDEADLKCRAIRIVRARKEHPCFVGMNPHGGDKHTIQPGDRARHETALVDGSFWGSYYVCLRCLDKWLDDINGVER